MYILASFTVKNLKKNPKARSSYKDASFFGPVTQLPHPNWPTCPEQDSLSGKPLIEWVQNKDQPFSCPKCPTCPEQEFYGKNH